MTDIKEYTERLNRINRQYDEEIELIFRKYTLLICETSKKTDEEKLLRKERNEQISKIKRTYKNNEVIRTAKERRKALRNTLIIERQEEIDHLTKKRNALSDTEWNAFQIMKMLQSGTDNDGKG